MESFIFSLNGKTGAQTAEDLETNIDELLKEHGFKYAGYFVRSKNSFKNRFYETTGGASVLIVSKKNDLAVQTWKQNENPASPDGTPEGYAGECAAVLYFLGLDANNTKYVELKRKLREFGTFIP